MKAFASDLDRTLIFSRRMLESFETECKYEPCEIIRGEPSSFISLKTKTILTEINNEMLFIPVTTRTKEQYQRIRLFQDEVVPEYAITNNGATILKNGYEIKEWKQFIKEELQSCLSFKQMIMMIEGMGNNSWIQQIKHADNLFIYLIVNNRLLSESKIAELKQWLKSLGWNISLQGRKLYIVPTPIEKWKATEYLCNHLDVKHIYTAGDSLLDYELITKSSYGTAPLHGEILKYYPSLTKTKSYGIKASEEIVEAVYNNILLKS
ncbi:HAD family hydrolase [Sutcliffiella halmapala]